MLHHANEPNYTPKAVGKIHHGRRPVDASTDAGKTTLLAQAICAAQAARSRVEMLDLTQSGVCERDAKRLYDAAMAKARKSDPALFGAHA
jgi:hypothetical protein